MQRDKAVEQYGFRPRVGHEVDYKPLLNRCEGQSFQTVAPHNGATFERLRHDKIARKGLGCKDQS